MAAQHYFLDKPLPQEKSEENEELDGSEEREQNEKEQDPVKKRLRKKIGNLEEQNDDLKQRIKSLKEEKNRLDDQLDDLRERDRFEAVKSQEVSKRDAVISQKNEEIEGLKKKLNKTSLREKQYRKAIRRIYQDDFLELLPIDDGSVVYRSDTYDVNEVEGLLLGDYFLLLDKPEPDMKQVLRDFKQGETDED